MFFLCINVNVNSLRVNYTYSYFSFIHLISLNLLFVAWCYFVASCIKIRFIITLLCSQKNVLGLRPKGYNSSRFKVTHLHEKESSRSGVVLLNTIYFLCTFDFSCWMRFFWLTLFSFSWVCKHLFAVCTSKMEQSIFPH